MRQYIIVGNGVAGVTAARAVVSADPGVAAHVYGAVLYSYYRRPPLWEFIAGQAEQDALCFRSPEWYAERSIHLHLGIEAVELGTTAHRLALTNGATVEYDRLLLATGARPFVPPCQGMDKEGVLSLGTLQDALAIKAYAPQVSTATSIGGGLLGLQTARAQSCSTTRSV
jgi:nitrite reductase (NADH) large subunit